MIDFTIEMAGRGAGLLMHNGRLSNPIDPATQAIKKVTSKRKKTDDDHRELARLEFMGSLYHDPDIGPYLPGENIWRSLYDAAKKHKLGPSVKEGVMILTDVNPLSYKGPRDMDGLWADKNFPFMASAKVGTSRVMRCRPRFRTWATAAEGTLDETILNWEEFEQVVATAAYRVGVGDWRPRFGLFDAVLRKTGANGITEAHTSRRLATLANAA